MKKGFTLIELLAVIGLLAAILIIAVPQILDVVYNARIKAYQDNELMMSKAAETYLAANRDLMPQSVGDTVEVTLDTLETSEYINELADKDGNCDGYILVTKTESGYSYNPELKCGTSNTIGDSTSDGLIINYTFDEFAESTINEIDPTGDFNLYAESVGNWKIEKLDDTTFKVTALVDDPTVSTWNNIASLNSNFGVGADVSVTYSVEILERSTNEIFVGSNGWGNIEDSDTLGNRKAETICHPAAWTHGFVFRVFNPLNISAGDYLIARGFQIEEKDHATPFVDGIRNDIVFNQAINDLNANMVLASSPKWINDGYYEFNDNEQLTYVEQNIANNFSVATWFKTSTNHEIDLEKTSGTAGTGGQNYLFGAYYPSLANESGMGISVGKNGISVYEHSESYMPPLAVYDSNIGEEWNHLVVVYNNKKPYIYFNGDLVREGLTSPKDNVYAPFQIGKGSYGAFSGYMDDVKIYDRVLNVEEIKYQYDLSKTKYE